MRSRHVGSGTVTHGGSSTWSCGFGSCAATIRFPRNRRANGRPVVAMVDVGEPEDSAEWVSRFWRRNEGHAIDPTEPHCLMEAPGCPLG